jgi:hypothetical protein
MQRRYSVVQDTSGNALSGASIAVTTSTGAAATLYSDNGVTPIANPVTSASNGEYYYYAANGVYSESISATGYGPNTVSGVLLFDPTDSTALDVEHFGAVGDGTTDDYVALQAAANYGYPVRLHAKTYCTSQPIVFTQGTRFLGSGNWSEVSSSYETTDATVIKYIGAGGANSCVLRLSKAAVGTEPTDPATRDLQNITLTDVVVDCNGLAEYGIYMVRAWSMNQLERLSVTNAVKFGFWAAACWNGSPKDWVAFKCQGAGFSLGKNPGTWTTYSCDQSVCTNFFGYYCGCDSSGNPLNQFNESTNPEVEFGIGVYSGRGLKLVNAQANNCSGVGFFVNPVLAGSIDFDMGYAENNGRSSGSTRQWDIWFNGDSGGSSWMVDFRKVFLGLTPAIKITGTSPSRAECGVRFERMDYLGTIDASWSNYLLTNCDRNVIFANKKPDYLVHRVGDLRGGLVGRGYFTVSGGAIASSTLGGVVASVTYSGVGLYAVTFTSEYTAALTSAASIFPQPHTYTANRIVNAINVTTSGFTIDHRDSAGVLTDASTIRFTVEGGY